MQFITADMYRQAAENIENGVSVYMCNALFYLVRDEYPDLDPDDILGAEFRPFLRRDGIPIDGTWLQPFGEIPSAESVIRRAAYLRSIANEVEKL